MTSQAVMKRYLTAVSKTEEYANNKTMQDLAIGIANFKKLDKKEQAELNAYIEGAYNKLQAKGFSVKKTPTKTTTTRKTRTTSQGGLKAILAELKKKLGSEKFKEATTGTDIQKDIKIPALKKGKRIVRKKGYTTNQYGTFKNQVGTAYWESRANRFDANQPSQTRKYKLADGGDISSYDNPKNTTHTLHIDGQNWYLEKIDSTHFYMSNNPKYRGMAHHIGQHKGESYYDEIKQWLRDTKFAKGGKTGKRSLMSVAHLVDWKGEGIKKWYTRSFPKDDLGEEINDTITFRDLWDALNEKKDVYEIIGVGDSLIRERLFEYLSLIYDVDYSVVYKKWLESSDNGYAKGGEVERGSAHIYITKTNGEYKVYHGSDVSLRKNAKPLYTSENNPEGTWDKIWSTLRGSKMANGGNTSKLTEAEREQAERELREAWEGKNADEYIMYSDKYKKGGVTEKLTKAKIKAKLYKPSGDFFIEEKGDRFILHLTPKDASTNAQNLKDMNAEDAGKGYHGSAYSVNKTIEHKYAKGGTTKRIKRKGC